MKTEWDYTELANAYLERPDYAESVLENIFSRAQLREKSKVCDIGAGVAHLTIPLAARGYDVVAVEPNDAMRANGIKRTEHFPNVLWVEAAGEHTKQADNAFALVTFGSSFNVLDRQAALRETYRILQPHGLFVCLWNHRDLDDPIQKEIESIIKQKVSDYGYGVRREDQTGAILEPGLFIDVEYLEGKVSHIQSIENVVEAWRSHATLHRQAGDNFGAIIQNIDSFLNSLGKKEILVPFTTRGWMAQRKD